MRKIPPYKLLAYVGSILLVLFVIAVYRFRDGQAPDWLFGVAWALAAAVLLGFVIDLVKMVRDYRAGVLFPMRNASFFIFVASVIGLPLYAIYTYATGGGFATSNLLLVPVFLFFILRNLFYVRLDNLSLEAKTGFLSPVSVPLFGITNVAVDDSRIKVDAENARPINLLRTFFFSGHWEKLVAQLQQYG